eukprot:CAMPEP_0174877764 /NCGR_PEP_ID=MMETSP1114-20130205/82420_1 /TAXON_ID=312471 /ORGANISM="Neobodo designis, Strain CCAP 1951/1" /LENGTH=234 /DNA_ID=CAMNT_0016113151 /DNA_START=126 /DNA_END=826 /DNA_ORIENTATION=-
MTVSELLGSSSLTVLERVALVASRRATAAADLGAAGRDVRLDVRARGTGGTEVLVLLLAGLATAHQEGVLAGRFDVRARGTGGTEVLVLLLAGLATAHQEGVLAGRRDHGELVEGEALTAGALDALAGAAREAQGADAEALGHLGHADVVEHVGDDDGDRGLRLGRVHPHGLAAHHGGDAAQRDRGAVLAALEEASGHGLVELRLRALGEELVQLHEKLAVRVRRQRVVAHAAL